MPKNIVIYGMNFAPEIAGVGKYTGEIATALSLLQCSVSVVTTHQHYPGWKRHDRKGTLGYHREIMHGMTVYRCPLYLTINMNGLRRLLAPLTFSITSAPVFIWQVLLRRPDIILVVEPTLLVAPISLLMAKIIEAKTIIHVQDLEIDAALAVGHLRQLRWLSKTAFFFERLIIRQFDRVITIAKAMATRIEDKGVDPKRIHVVRNWVDVQEIRPIDGVSKYRETLKLGADAFIVLYSGNIGAKQGIGVLLSVARRLLSHPNIVFVIAGDGPLRKNVEEAAHSLPNLRVFDFQPTNVFSEFLGIADVHVLPQEQDTADLLLPSKLGGMLASGRKILATTAPHTELAAFLGNACVLTPPGDVDAMASAILVMASSKTEDGAKTYRLNLASQLAKEPALKAFTKLILTT